MKLEHLVTISGAVLVVYDVGGRYYRYEILFWDASIYQPKEIYESADKALNVGVESIRITIGY